MANVNSSLYYSAYKFKDQPYVYTLCEERRDWRKYIEKHITLAKEEIMGRNDEDELVSVATAQREIENHIEASEASTKENSNSNTSSILSAIENLKTWWNSFRPSWA